MEKIKDLKIIKKDTKRKSQCFADFSVDYVKQFSANDIAHAIQGALKDGDFSNIYISEIDDVSIQWVIHGVFHKIGFYDYRK